MDRAEIRLKCVDLALSIQSQRSADAVVEQARKIEAWVVAPMSEDEVKALIAEWGGLPANGGKIEFIPLPPGASGAPIFAGDPVAVPVPKKPRAY